MASSEQFPSGLNKWADTDKPTRIDFVGDNQIIDQNAMWKSTYDAQGAIEQLGGISAYVDKQAGDALAKSQSYSESYSQSLNRAVATAAAGNPGTLEIASDVARAQDWYDVQFVAPGDYDPNQQVTIDGAAVALSGIDGSSLSAGAWKAGAVVTLSKKGELAFFKQGGGGKNPYNFDIITVASASALPPSPAANTIAVVTATPLPASGRKYVFQPYQPAKIQNSIWILTKDYSTDLAFNLLSTGDYLGVYPTSAWQFEGEAAAPTFKQAYIFLNGKWTALAHYAYNAGNQFTALTGGWQVNSGGAAILADAIQVGGAVPRQNGMSWAYTVNQISFAEVKQLRFEVVQTNGDNCDYRFGISSMQIPNGSQWVAVNAQARPQTDVVGTVMYTLDVSAYNGNYYIVCNIQNRAQYTGVPSSFQIRYIELR